LSALLGLLLLGACAYMPKIPPLPTIAEVKQSVGLAPAPPPDPKTQMAALETRIAVLVEEQRMRLDPAAKPLAIDPELSRIARQKAADMAAQNYLAHDAPNGDTAATLLMAQDANFQGLLGENLAAQHYTMQSGVAVDAFATRFLYTWMNSTPHRENLAFPDYNRTGVGAAVSGDTVYVAQLFATDLGLGPHQDKDPASAVTSFESPRAAKETKPPPGARLRGANGSVPAQ
jgi:uncharacterized protein YkwD